MVMNSVEEFLPPFVYHGVCWLWVVIAVVGLWRGWFRQGRSIGDLMKRIEKGQLEVICGVACCVGVIIIKWNMLIGFILLVFGLISFVIVRRFDIESD